MGRTTKPRPRHPDETTPECWEFVAPRKTRRLLPLNDRPPFGAYGARNLYGALWWQRFCQSAQIRLATLRQNCLPDFVSQFNDRREILAVRVDRLGKMHAEGCPARKPLLSAQHDARA